MRSIASCAKHGQPIQNEEIREVCQQLLSAASKRRKPRTKPRDEVIKSRVGVPLFRIRRRSKSIAVILPLDKISEPTLEEIRNAIVDVLKTVGGRRPAGAMTQGSYECEHAWRRRPVWQQGPAPNHRPVAHVLS